MDKQSSLLPQEDQYFQLLDTLKQRIRSAQIRAALAVNTEALNLYWQIGKDILTRQQEEGWGAKVVTRLAKDLRKEFPDIKGFSKTNLMYMRVFADAYPDEQIVLRVVGKIPWGHNQSLLNKLNDLEQRLWYASKTVENGWRRPILELQIEHNLYKRQGGAVTNFEHTLPPAQSEVITSAGNDFRTTRSPERYSEKL